MLEITSISTSLGYYPFTIWILQYAYQYADEMPNIPKAMIAPGSKLEEGLPPSILPPPEFPKHEAIPQSKLYTYICTYVFIYSICTYVCMYICITYVCM